MSVDSSGFAKSIMEQLGWKEGKGLGKNENGISTFIRPAIRIDKRGIGLTHQDKVNDHHWFDQAYNVSCNSISVGKKNRIKKDKNKALKTEEKKKYALFVSGGTVAGSQYNENPVAKKIQKKKSMESIYHLDTDELMNACNGMTGHKGARHGLTMSGKLARIKKQEELFTVEPASPSRDGTASPSENGVFKTPDKIIANGTFITSQSKKFNKLNANSPFSPAFIPFGLATPKSILKRRESINDSEKKSVHFSRKLRRCHLFHKNNSISEDFKNLKRNICKTGNFDVFNGNGTTLNNVIKVKSLNLDGTPIKKIIKKKKNLNVEIQLSSSSETELDFTPMKKNILSADLHLSSSEAEVDRTLVKKIKKLKKKKLNDEMLISSSSETEIYNNSTPNDIVKKSKKKKVKDITDTSALVMIEKKKKKVKKLNEILDQTVDESVNEKELTSYTNNYNEPEDDTQTDGNSKKRKIKSEIEFSISPQSYTNGKTKKRKRESAEEEQITSPPKKKRRVVDKNCEIIASNVSDISIIKTNSLISLSCLSKKQKRKLKKLMNRQNRFDLSNDQANNSNNV